MHSSSGRTGSGQPRDAWKRKVIPVPGIGPQDVLIYVMATGINYNNVWAALGKPLDVIAERQRKGEPEDFHAGGSDAAGIVWAVGAAVTNVKPGDEVVVHSGWWEPDDPWVLSGRDPMLAESTRIWGYQTNYGSYCQFAPRSVPPVHPQAEGAELGLGRLLPALRLDRLPHAHGLGAQRGRARRRGPGVGGGGRPRQHGPADHRGHGRASGRGGLGRCQGPILPRSRRRRRHQPHRVRPLGRDARRERSRLPGLGQGCEGLRQGDLGRGR